MKSIKNSTFFIVPVYNEEVVIKKTIKEIMKSFPHVVCVDDGSTDNSAVIIQQTGAALVKHPVNMGQGAALQTGIEFARSFSTAQYFVTFDADGQHRIEDVQKMLKVIEKEDIDIVFGSRFLGLDSELPKLKYRVLKLATAFSNFTSGLKLTDTHNGLRIFNRNVAEKINITMSDMAHASEILEIIKKNGFRYKEVPVKIIYTDYSLSKGQSILNSVNIAFDVLLKRILK